jgi:hypothetical protein
MRCIRPRRTANGALPNWQIEHNPKNRLITPPGSSNRISAVRPRLQPQYELVANQCNKDGARYRERVKAGLYQHHAEDWLGP